MMMLGFGRGKRVGLWVQAIEREGDGVVDGDACGWIVGDDGF